MSIRKSNVIREKVIISRPQLVELKEINDVANTYGLVAAIKVTPEGQAKYTLIENMSIGSRSMVFPGFANKLEVMTYLAKSDIKKVVRSNE